MKFLYYAMMIVLISHVQMQSSFWPFSSKFPKTPTDHENYETVKKALLKISLASKEKKRETFENVTVTLPFTKENLQSSLRKFIIEHQRESKNIKYKIWSGTPDSFALSADPNEKVEPGCHQS